METKSGVGNHDYGAALRVIGQELADLLPLSLEIDVKENRFLVTGRGLPESATASGSGKTVLARVWRSLIGRDPGTDLVDWQLKSIRFSRSYSQEDIASCDQRRIQNRNNAAGLPDIYSLGERLRIIGRIIDAQDGELVHLSKSLNHVEFEYRDRDGAVHAREYSAEELYRLQRLFYSQRQSETTNYSDHRVSQPNSSELR